MSDPGQWRQYLLIDRTAAEKDKEFFDILNAANPPPDQLASVLSSPAWFDYPLEGRVLPLPDWSFQPQVRDPAPTLRDQQAKVARYVTAPLAFDSPDQVDEFWRHYRAYKEREPDDRIFVALNADLAIAPSDYSCPFDQSGVMLGRRSHARRLIRIDELTPAQQAEITGASVNVVLFDQGIDQESLPAGQFAGGWTLAGAAFPPGGTPPDKARHSTMMLRNILDCAPNATMWDVPLIQQPRLGDINAFISWAEPAIRKVFQDIGALPKAQFPGPWVFVNAWAPYDLRLEYPKGVYSNNALNSFNILMNDVVSSGIDVIFCAGNCGAFCPDGRCGPEDIGPGRSILGAASHSRVLCASAVRVDSMWIGYASQGPGQPNLSTDKPDICGPSGFAEDHDNFTGNIGTSAASGVVAGAVAALRTRWKPGVVAPDTLRAFLRATAQKTSPLPSRQTGYGILDISEAYKALRLLYP